MFALKRIKWSQPTIASGRIGVRGSLDLTRSFSKDVHTNPRTRSGGVRGSGGLISNTAHQLSVARRISGPQISSARHLSISSLFSSSSSENQTAPPPSSTGTSPSPLSSPSTQPSSSELSQSTNNVPASTTLDPSVSSTADSSTPLGSLESLGIFNQEDAVFTERLGYLKDLGLDFGWGPTAMTEWFLEHVHVLTGTPWWLSVVITLVILRSSMVPLFLGASDTTARMGAMKPITDPLMEKVKAAQQSGDAMALSQNSAEMQKVFREAGIKPWKMGGPLIQAVFGFGVFRLMRNMATLPVPGLDTGGILWFQDLTISDPYFVLPLATATIAHFSVRLGGEVGATNTMSPKMLQFMLYGIPAVTVLFGVFWPALLQLSFLVAASCGFVQGVALRSPGFRAWAGLYPLQKRAAPPVANSGPTAKPFGGKINVAPTYQSPKLSRSVSSDSISPEPAPKAEGVLGGALAEMKGMGREVVRSMERYTGRNIADAGKSNTAEKRRAQAYEKRRQAEEDKKRWEARELRRTRRSRDQSSP
ncbi:MAG: hypothetical protein M4579_001601 [Chaenotheca gracillima]|nr:MAG: hypothetical protein M4579_001601 [Chaenotheca gracillima]